MSGLLYPAYQKLYSSLSNLERFNKEANFFDNITAIDSFFNEYRNITFVLQSSLKHTEFFTAYEKNKDKYLTDHWFVEKRNETIKQKPFPLIKEIKITLYLPFGGFTVCEKKFSVENDKPLDSLLSELKKMLVEIDKHEVCFSVSFFFHEENSDIDLLEKVCNGISSMKKFMESMDNDVGEDCQLCNQLKDQIDKIHFADMALDFLTVNDYTYYPDKDLFDKAERISLILGEGNKKVATHRPLIEMTNSKNLNYDGTVFGNFTFLHAVIQSTQVNDIAPAIMVVYDDGTYDLDAFAADMKTTMYRKINEVAQLAYKQDVTEVCYASLYTQIRFNEDTPKTSFERIKQATSEILVSASINKHLDEKEYIFNREHLNDAAYVACVMKNGLNKELNISANNLFPIRCAFEKKREINLIQTTSD